MNGNDESDQTREMELAAYSINNPYIPHLKGTKLVGLVIWT